MASSSGTVTTSSPTKGLYDPKAFVTHAALLRQAFAHCAKFLAAASRRSLGRVSVPVWLSGLSAQLPIVALVGRYPTNQPNRPHAPRPAGLRPFLPRHPEGAHAVLAALSDGYPPLGVRSRTCYSPVRHWVPKHPVRLACVRHAASVYPEPGSNSPSKHPTRFPWCHARWTPPAPSGFHLPYSSQRPAATVPHGPPAPARAFLLLFSW